MCSAMKFRKKSPRKRPKKAPMPTQHRKSLISSMSSNPQPSKRSIQPTTQTTKEAGSAASETVEPLQSFDCFPDLPTELCDAIWAISRQTFVVKISDERKRIIKLPPPSSRDSQNAPYLVVDKDKVASEFLESRRAKFSIPFNPCSYGCTHQPAQDVATTTTCSTEYRLRYAAGDDLFLFLYDNTSKLPSVDDLSNYQDFRGIQRIALKLFGPNFTDCSNHQNLLSFAIRFPNLEALILLDCDFGYEDLVTENELKCLYRLDKNMVHTFEDSDYLKKHPKFQIAALWFKASFKCILKNHGIAPFEIKIMTMRSS